MITSKKIVFPLLFLCTVLNSQNFCNQLSEVVEKTYALHYQPKALNDSLSVNVIELFLNELDPKKQYFTSKDSSMFYIDELKLDNYIANNQCNFIFKFIDSYKSRLQETKAILKAIHFKSLDYSGKDSIHFNANKNPSFLKDSLALKSYWNKYIRYKILFEMIENDSLYTNIDENFKSLEEELKPKIIDNAICLITEIENEGIQRYVEEAFLRAFLKYQDPHSTFFNTSDKSLYEKSVSNTQLTIGIETQKSKEGDIYISYITPGSVAFKSGKLDVKDKILYLSNGTETLETLCSTNTTITAFINDEANKIITLKIKKQSGKTDLLTLKKTNLKVEENAVRGYLLSGKNLPTVGYIKIPSFYTNLESINGLGLANDVAKQLYILQKDNIKGLILDLRFNGGGSIKEAIDLSGMFINKGTISISKDKQGEEYEIKDFNRGALFSKPLIIIVNEFSASASEIFASAIQDYKAGIIIGSITHGKASGQNIIPLYQNKTFGFIKLTVSQFYRIDGTSHQSKGVTPDIIIPSFYNNFKTQEAYYKYALPNYISNTQTKYIVNNTKYKIDKLRHLSQKRIDTSMAFKKMKTTNTYLVKNYINKKISYPLTLKNVYEDYKAYKDVWKDYELHTKTYSSKINFENTNSTKELLSYNEDDYQMNQKLLVEYSKDIIIEEAYSIIQNTLNK